MVFCSAITFPSYLTMPLLLWACITIIVPSKWFSLTALVTLFYFELVFAIQYVFNLNATEWNVSAFLGLV